MAQFHDDAQVAVFVRRLGTLPFGLAIGSSDVGEARLSGGSQCLITWGRNIPPAEQAWWIANTRFHPVWCGADDGSCELILCTQSDEELSDWIHTGLALGENPPWIEVSPITGIPGGKLFGPQRGGG